MEPSITATIKAYDHERQRGCSGRSVLLCLACVLSFLVLLLWVYPSNAETWQDSERACLRACPSMPRYSGIETDARYKARMEQQAAYDRCFMSCARESAASQPRTFVPIGEPEARYFKRNGG